MRLLFELSKRVGLDLKDRLGGGGGHHFDVAGVEGRGDRDGRGEGRADDAGEHGGKAVMTGRRQSAEQAKRMHWWGVKHCAFVYCALQYILSLSFLPAD